MQHALRLRRISSALSATFIVFLSSLSFVAAACGGGDADASPLETFFQDVRQVIDDADEDADAVEEGMDADLSTAVDFEDLLNVLEQGVEGFQELARDTGAELEDIDAPQEARELHDEFVQIYSRAADALEDIQAELSDVDPSESEDVLFAKISQVGDDIVAEFGSLGDRSSEICMQLQEIADKHEVDVDLDCRTPDEEGS